jgi:hypothetical protein
MMKDGLDAKVAEEKAANTAHKLEVATKGTEKDHKYYKAYKAALKLQDFLHKSLKIQVVVTISSQEYDLTEINRSEESDDFVMHEISPQLRP